MSKGVFSWQELLAPLKKRRPLIAGIVNVTPDSFSDGCGSVDIAERQAFALRLLDEGADIIDLGGESTRPGAAEIAADVEWARIEPVLKGILQIRRDAVVSIDTRHSRTAAKALQAGAKIINDVSGMEFDPAMAEVIAGSQAGAILTYSAAIPELMQQKEYVVEKNIVDTAEKALQKIVQRARTARIAPAQIMLDAGIGFGKSRSANYTLLRHAQWFEQHFGLPFCWGVSRKSLLRTEPDTLEKRIAGSVALAVKLSEQNVSLLRVHDVAQTAAALTASWEFDTA